LPIFGSAAVATDDKANAAVRVRNQIRTGIEPPPSEPCARLGALPPSVYLAE